MVFSLTEVILTRVWDDSCHLIKPQKLSLDFPACYTQITFDTGSSISLYAPSTLSLAKDHKSQSELIRFTGVNNSIVTECHSFTIQIVKFWENNNCLRTAFNEINVLSKSFPSEKICGEEHPFNKGIKPAEWDCQAQDSSAILLGSADSIYFPHPCDRIDTQWLRAPCPKLEVWVSRVTGAPLLQGQISYDTLQDKEFVSKMLSFLTEIRNKYNLFQFLTLNNETHISHLDETPP